MTDSSRLREAVQRAFRPATGPTTIGLELEVHVRQRHHATSLPGTPRQGTPRQGTPLHGAGEWDGELAAHSLLSCEPGGQLELSLPPQGSVSALLHEVDACLDLLTA